MNDSEITPPKTVRRRFLGKALAWLTAVGVTLSAIPLVRSWLPSADRRIAGGPIEVDLDEIAPGEQRLVPWRGKPVWILRRTPEMLKHLRGSELRERLLDPLSEEDQQPAYASNELRSIRPDILVVIGICTHLGCIPKFHPQAGRVGFDAQWPGGYFCPCHNSKFDLAGRVFKNVPAPLNLAIPPYRFTENNTVIIGENPES